MKKMAESEARLSLQAAALLDALRLMALKSTTSPENVRRLLKTCALQWYADTQLFQNLESESPMSSKECSVLH
jgi:hypothetical protein